jgi:hypothetical protein
MSALALLNAAAHFAGLQGIASTEEYISHHVICVVFQLICEFIDGVTSHLVNRCSCQSHGLYSHPYSQVLFES